MPVEIQKIGKRNLLLKPLVSIIILAFITAGIFHIFHQHWIKSLSERVEMQHRQNIIQIVTIARNTVEPVLNDYRSGKISRERALGLIRALVRSMTYMDQYGNNYVFMSSYDGRMLVQPFEPGKEMTDQWDFRDSRGTYVVRELVNAARKDPEGSFVEYYYFLPGLHSDQKKLAYVVGIPELGCYIGTGMYMQKVIQEQLDILKSLKYGTIGLFFAVIIPLSVSILFILNRNRLLLNEIASGESLEHELKKSEEKYRSIFENVPQGLYQTEPDGRFLSGNRTLAKMYGYETPEEMIRETYNVGEQYYADQSSRDELLKIMEEKGHVEKFIARYRRRDGTLFWGSINARAVRDGAGKVLYYEGSIENITTLIEAESRVRQSEEKFQKVFMTSPEGIAVTHLIDGRLIDVNPGFEKITGWKKDEVVGKTSYDIGFWENLSARELMLDDLKKGGSVLYRDFRFRRKDMAIRSGTYSAISIIIADEDSLVFIMHDITERKQMEEEQRRLEQQLFQSQKMEAIGQLAGGVAHDFNNILTGIQGLVSLMMINRSTDETSRNRLTKIEEQIRRGSALTKQLLDLAHEGKNEKRAISINDLLKKNAQLFMEAKKGIEIDFRLDDKIHPVEADPGQIEQVILNLFINADHAMPDGGSIFIETVNITIDERDSKSFQLKPGDYVRVSVADTGTGMDSETIKRIFEPFFTTKKEQGGTGLGLASSYGIIRNHNGIINAYSEPGHGSTFNIYLPSSLKQVANENNLPSRNLFYGNGTILVVDDEKPILEAASEMLIILGYDVFQASSGDEALSIYRDKGDSIDLVILDMIMPVMSGSQVLKALREIDPGIKIILSSGYMMQGNSVKVLEYGYSSFMQKPYSIIDLSRIVHEALSARPL